MKVLCICSHGNVRSVALAYLIKTIYKHEAIAIGIKPSSIETLKMLYAWADMIVVTTSGLGIKAPTDINKIRLLDIGEDIWHNPFAQELQHKLLKSLKDLNL